MDRQGVDAWIEAQKELEELKKTPSLTDAEAQGFFEGVEKGEDRNIIVLLAPRRIRRLSCYFPATPQQNMWVFELEYIMLRLLF